MKITKHDAKEILAAIFAVILLGSFIGVFGVTNSYAAASAVAAAIICGGLVSFISGTLTP